MRELNWLRFSDISCKPTWDLFEYHLLLKTKNTKIIFKCMNSTVGPIFNVYFIEKNR